MLVEVQNPQTDADAAPAGLPDRNVTPAEAEPPRDPASVGGEMPSRDLAPSFRNAAPHFLPLAVFPLLGAAALHGGWWTLGPFAFLFVNGFDAASGVEVRNMDPDRDPEAGLFWYKLSAWIWAALWPAALAFALWQIFASGHLAGWEAALVVAGMAGNATSVFTVGHEFIHRRSVWERRVGEFLLASVSYPLYATEHVYIHHSLVCTPGDPESAPRGVSFWRFLWKNLPRSIMTCWRFERDRLARRRLPVWHFTNAFWRYAIETAAWYALAWWLGGIWGVVIFAVLGGSVVFQIRVSDYVQHYGLRRLRLPGGRFERVQRHHTWSAAYRLSNWLFYNGQRHPDHHAASNRRYPLLQHCGDDRSPQLPATYGVMNGLALFPERWFSTMDPLLDEARARFYPQIQDWSAYDSAAFAARPEAVDAIAEIMGSAPRLAEWMNRSPELLDSLRTREFTDLDLAPGFGPDREFERIARRGLARLYWTRELGPREMAEQLAEAPTQDAGEAVDAAREWANNKVFQLAVHTMRGNLAPAEAGRAAGRVAEAALANVLSGVWQDFRERRSPEPGSGICAIVFGPVASGEALLDSRLEVQFLLEDGSPDYYEVLCRRFRTALRSLSRENLWLAPLSRDWAPFPLRPLADFVERGQSRIPVADLRRLLQARCVFAQGRPGLAERFEAARRDLLGRGAVRNALLVELSPAPVAAPDPDLSSYRETAGGGEDVERAARFLQVRHAAEFPDLLALDRAEVFRFAGGKGLIAESAAERLAEAAILWQNLGGILQIVGESASVAESTSDAVRAVVARAAGEDDFTVLNGRIQRVAARVRSDLGAMDPEAQCGPAFVRLASARPDRIREHGPNLAAARVSLTAGRVIGSVARRQRRRHYRRGPTPHSLLVPDREGPPSGCHPGE